MLLRSIQNKAELGIINQKVHNICGKKYFIIYYVDATKESTEYDFGLGRSQ
jgi:hypothetical protein